MTAVTRPIAPARSDAIAGGQPREALVGLGAMLSLVWRRNRVRLVVWWAVIVGLAAFVMAYYRDILTTQESLDDFAAISNTPAIKALTGLAAAANTMGGAVWTKIWMTCALTLAFAVVFLVTRNGRADEEAGRTELLRSRVLGVHAYGMATWIWCATLSLAVGAGVAAASIAFDLDPAGTGVTGSLIFGLSMAGIGLLGLGVGALAGQVASTSRGANALGSAVLGVFYLMRMAGDLGDGTLTWMSPIGWAQKMQPWGVERWWPLGLLVLLCLALLAAATAVETRREFGAGVAPQRKGRPAAPPRFAHPLGLALHLQRGPIIGWAITVVATALMLGSVVEAMADMVADVTGVAASVLAGGIDALLSLFMMMLALLVTAFAVQTTNSMRAEEASGLVEPQLVGAISRVRWVCWRLAIPVVGSAVLLLVGGWLTGAEYGAVIGKPGQAGVLALAAVAYWPAVMVFVGLAVALFGWLPRQAIAVSWGAIVAMFFVVLLGDAMRLPDWLVDVLPFSATPSQPAEAFAWLPVLLLAAVAVALGWLGVERFRRRDLQVG